MAELSGSVLVSLVGDRLGKGRSVLVSSALALVAYVLLPALDFQTLPIVVGLIIARFLFEVSIVSSISLLSEQVPAERGKVLALASAVVTMGAALASVTGPLMYEAWGITGPAAIAAISALVAVMLTVLWVNDRDQL
jgi:predicted MFS family arabinose efflux permease